MRPDSYFVSELKRGSASAFKCLYNKYADKIFRVSRGFFLEREEAKEIVQEVFLTLWEKKDQLDERLSINAFLLTVTRNKILNFHRKKVANLERNRVFIEYNSPSNSTEDEFLFQELKSFTLGFIESLPHRRKEIFLLSRRQGLKNTEIAKLLNISLRTVENNIYQAEKEIRSFLEENHLLIKGVFGSVGIFFF